MCEFSSDVFSQIFYRYMLWADFAALRCIVVSPHSGHCTSRMAHSVVTGGALARPATIAVGQALQFGEVSVATDTRVIRRVELCVVFRTAAGRFVLLRPTDGVGAAGGEVPARVVTLATTTFLCDWAVSVKVATVRTLATLANLAEGAITV